MAKKLDPLNKHGVCEKLRDFLWKTFALNVGGQNFKKHFQGYCFFKFYAGKTFEHKPKFSGKSSEQFQIKFLRGFVWDKVGVGEDFLIFF